MESATELGLFIRAVCYSADKHRYQRRKGVDAPPYINHAIEVADLLANMGGVNELPTLLAAVLHDTVEDTDATYGELEKTFGREVRLLVAEVTDDKDLPKTERKRLQVEHAPSMSERAKQIKIADKICNVRDVTCDPPADWSLKRRREYIAWAEKVVDGCRGANSNLSRYFDEVLSEAWSRLGKET